MKIEKISENQIRCTLTSEDLQDRQIRLSELAYGSEKAKALFRDMMQEAAYRVGFDSGNAPLMIEAIPTSMDSIVLVITRVEDPEELDTRFSRFTKAEDDLPSQEAKPSLGADDILDLFQKIYEAKKAAGQNASSSAPETAQTVDVAPEKTDMVNLVQSFRFRSLDDLILAAHSLQDIYTGRNTVYRASSPETDYQLVLHQSDSSPEAFNKVCNILSEYGKNEPFTPAREAYLQEHGEVLVANTALQELALLPA